MRIIYMKMLSLQLMDLMKYDQAPDFTFDADNWSYKMFKHTRMTKVQKSLLIPIVYVYSAAIWKLLMMILAIYF